MTDRELLELAAKAAGIIEFATASFWSKGYRVRDGSGDGWYPWNPLTDDGDAFRLAVQLRLIVEAGANRAIVSHPGFDAGVWYEHSDPYAATRRAIVRAAAEIGRTMT